MWTDDARHGKRRVTGPLNAERRTTSRTDGREADRSTGGARCAATAAVILLAGAACLASAAPTAAQGWIEPADGAHVVRLRTVVSVDVTDRIARIEVEEWFENRSRLVAEGSYLYPLPGEAVFSGYSLFQGDRELRGETMDADRARAIYESIVARRKDPALIELAGHGLIRARVFPIEPGQTRKITLRYTQVLERAGDALQLRYAAGIRQAGRAFPDRRVGPGPVPEPMPVRRPVDPSGTAPLEPQALRAPSGARVGPTAQRPTTQQRPNDEGSLTFVVRIEDGERYRDPFSPTHELRIERRAGRITVRPESDLEGDFELFLPLADGLVGMTLATHRVAEENGYFMLTVSPGTVDAPATPRDITAVVDVSGSMSGGKLDQTREALHQLLGSLGSEDRFRLVAFSDRVRTFHAGWSDQDDMAGARAWVDRLVADGGTNIAGALEEAFAVETTGDRLPMVLFLTDGLPTVGERDPERIAARAEADRGTARIFAFGVGYDVNTLLLDRLGEAGRGATEYVEPGEDVERAVGLLSARIRHPILTDLTVADAPVRLVELYPGELPDLFAGEELVVFGRYEADGDRRGRLRIAGRRAGRVERFGTVASFPARQEANDYIPRLWASRKIGVLTRQVRLHGADPELVEEIRETALRYGILTEYTAHLVQEPAETFARGGARLDAMAAQAARAPASGQGAVARAEAARRSREVQSAADMAKAEEAIANMPAVARLDRRVVAGRLFVRLDEEAPWRQVEASDDVRTVAVRPFSEGYFALLRAAPELRQVLRAFEHVVVAGVRANVALAPDGAERLGDRQLDTLVRDFRGH